MDFLKKEEEKEEEAEKEEEEEEEEEEGGGDLTHITRMLKGELQVQLDPGLKQWLAQPGTHATCPVNQSLGQRSAEPSMAKPRCNMPPIRVEARWRGAVSAPCDTPKKNQSADPRRGGTEAGVHHTQELSDQTQARTLAT